jgi:hypothetical protein
MKKQSWATGTIIVSLVTLCLSTVCCATGIYAVADQGRTVAIGHTAAIPMILLGVVVWIVPPLAWSFAAEEEEGRDDVQI